MRSANGALVPLGTLVEVRDVSGPDLIQRYNMYTSVPLQGNPAAGVSSGEALDEMETYFHTFLRSAAGRELKSECLLPTMVGDMLREGSMHVDAYTTAEAWFGMTYHEDRATSAAMLRKLTAEGMYPENLY